MTLNEITVGEIADLLKDAGDGGPKACLLIGAGVSKTAGIGLAPDFVARIKGKYPEIYAATCAKLVGEEAPAYAHCMAALPPARQVQLVREDIDQAKINWAHIGIARLECAEIIDSILTPNFDPLASRACALFHRFPAIYDLAGLRDHSANHIDFDKSYVKGSAIFHLHGQHTGFLLLNTDEKLLAQAKRIRPVLDAAMKGKPVIIAGYSGGNDPLVDEIAALAPFNHGLFWICHDGADPAPNVCDKLLSRDNCRIVRNMPADRFFTELANALKLEPPKFMFNPFDHMLGVLATIECYSEDGDSPQDSLLAQAKTHLQSATKALGLDASGSEIAKLMSAGEYEEVWQRFSDNPEGLSEADKDQVAWAAIAMGNALSAQGRRNQGADADALFSRAYEKYAAALAIKPDKYEAFNNWGGALTDQAQGKHGAEAIALLAQACEKHASALAIKPDVYEALYNWGNALKDQAMGEQGVEAAALFVQASEKYAAALEIKPDLNEALNNWGGVFSARAKSMEGAEADALFEQAHEKYAAALAIQPAMHEALYNWGNALFVQSKHKQGAEADAHLLQACEKYAAALAIKPDKDEVLNNWGNVLWAQANRKQGAEADRLFSHACEKYAAAIAIKPDKHEAFNNWGTALSDKAKGKTGAEADLLLEQAYEKYAAALAIKPDFHELLNNWGTVLSNHAKREQGAKADALFARAAEKYAAALEVKPDFHDALLNWAAALQDQAKGKQGEEADALFAQAYEKYAAVLVTKRDNHTALSNWGVVLSDQAARKQGAEADALFLKAYEKFADALAVKADFHDALNNWGAALSAQAHGKGAPDAELLLAEAEEKFGRAEVLSPGAATYNLACLSGLRGLARKSANQLRKSKKFGIDFPGCDHIASDTDFDLIRDTPEFRKAMVDIGCSPATSSNAVDAKRGRTKRK